MTRFDFLDTNTGGLTRVYAAHEGKAWRKLADMNAMSVTAAKDNYEIVVPETGYGTKWLMEKRMGREKRAPATCGLCGKTFRDDEEYAKHLDTYGHKVLFNISMRG